MSFDTIYADAPDNMREGLRVFRETHPMQSVTVDGIQWNYVDTGCEGDVILWLVGGLRMADAAFRSIPLMRDDFRIIAPDYPVLYTMDDLADGLAGLLDALNISSVHILCGSFGGMLGQVFVRRHGTKVKSLILSTTTAPNADHATRYQEQRAMIQDLDEAMLMQGAQVQMLNTMQPPEDEVTFWQAYLKELFEQRLSKDALMSTYDCLIEYLQRNFTPDDLTDWTAQLLIIGVADDATFGNDDQNALLALYPQAKTHIFESGGHSPSSTHRDTYFQIVREFFTPQE